MHDFKNELNSQQYAAATSAMGRNLILAGAGSGKTRTLTYKVAHLLEVCKVNVYNILLLTFTNKAAKEMLSRVEEITQIDSRLFWGGTFHSIGLRSINFFAEEIGLKKPINILDESDAQRLVKQAIEKVASGLENKDAPKDSVLKSIFSYSINTMQTISSCIEDKFPSYKKYQNQIGQAFEVYNQLKLANSDLDFDDLLYYWYKLLSNSQKARDYFQEKFNYILVDEYQDTNVLQAKIIDILSAKYGNLTVVGDEQQCIYTWRGAQFENIINFPKNYDNVKVFKIEKNYRSTPEILSLANSCVINQSEASSFGKILEPVNQSGQIPYLLAVVDTKHQAMKICQIIENLIYEYGYNPQDIAILYRSHFQAMDMEIFLRKSNISYSITSGIKFFDKAHIKDIVSHLKFVINQKNPLYFLRIAEKFTGIGPKTALLIYNKAFDISKKNNLSIVKSLSDNKILNLKKLAKSKDFFLDYIYTLQNIEEYLCQSGYVFDFEKDSLVKQNDDIKEEKNLQLSLFDEDTFQEDENSKDEFLDNVILEKNSSKSSENSTVCDIKIGAIIEIIIESWYEAYMKTLYLDYEERIEDIRSLKEFADDFDSLESFLQDSSLATDEEKDNSSENSSFIPRIKMSTIHQAKGLEFKVVFLLGLADESFPSKRSIEEDNLDEERRLFYVAVTRAMEKLYMFYPRQSQSKGQFQNNKPSRFLKELSSSTFELIKQ